jgi:hypothetical protein
MSDCTWLSDRIPAVAVGQSTWTPEEVRHLADCCACRDEWEVVRRSVLLGEDVVAELDTGVTARLVLKRLAADREKVRFRTRSWGFAGVASAAAIAAVLWSGAPTVRPTAKSLPAVTALQLPLPELDNLQPSELNSVLQTFDEPYVGDSTDNSAGDDLDAGVLDGGYDPLEG